MMIDDDSDIVHNYTHDNHDAHDDFLGISTSCGRFLAHFFQSPLGASHGENSNNHGNLRGPPPGPPPPKK